MKEKAVNIEKVNLFSIPFILLFIPLSLVAFKMCHGINFKETFYQNPLLLVYIVISLPILIVLHELIHGLFFGLYSKSRFKKISFGVMWKHLAPYCHCKEAIKAKHYAIVLLMPSILLGFLPFVMGFMTGSFFAVFIGAIMIMCGAGDYIGFSLVLKVPSDTLVIDHSSKVGFYYGDV